MQSIHYIERSTGILKQEVVPKEQWLKWLYHNPIGKSALHLVVKKKFLSAWYGRKMDAPASSKKIPGFIRQVQVNMAESAVPASDFKSFNDFFIRRLKPDARPIDPLPESIVSPADGKLLAFADMRGFDTFFVKGQVFSLEKFLGNRTLAERYTNGTLLIIRLAPVDYHRFHFPADGVISSSQVINGSYCSVSPYAVQNRLRIYWENKRAYSLLETIRAGDIVLCEVGATMVGSIVQAYEPESQVRKGQEKGWFKFGGSTVIVLLEKGKILVDNDLLENTRKGFETSITVGERVGVACG
ncbi:MAG: phosphatidylserine decarboxylase [Desulfobulbus propionicus]|nr:MAG: phosphatidylserine decarboxylase [Desulfobulbus propionicus]